MTLKRVAGKRRTVAMPETELAALRAECTRTVVDVGTGDGRYAYAVASAHSDWLVIGIDALDEPMGEIAYKAARKPAKGGRPNLVLLHTSIENAPQALNGIADELTVLLPWGRLLEGIVTADPAVFGALARLVRAGGVVRVTLNGEIWIDSLPERFADLPVPDPQYVDTVIAPAFAAAGVECTPARILTAEEAHALPTTWARRLGHTRTHPQFVHFEGTKRGGGPDGDC